MKYQQQLEKELKEKQAKMDELLKQRNSQQYKENFYNMQSGINSLSVDIDTLKSRIDNIHTKRTKMPDIDNVNTASKYR